QRWARSDCERSRPSSVWTASWRSSIVAARPRARASCARSNYCAKRSCPLSADFDGGDDLVTEAAAGFRKDLRRCVAAVADHHDVVEPESDKLGQTLRHVLRRTDDA